MFVGLISWILFLLVLKACSSPLLDIGLSNCTPLRSILGYSHPVIHPFIGDVESSSPRCDSVLSFVSEGVLGETKTFPWLGVLRVHLHEGKSLKIALTGIVLVKEGFAIANADDVARIPKRVFQEDSRAMFIPRDKQPWFCKLKDYMTHPEFEYETVNTIALVELDLGNEKYYPMSPICWPSYSYNASDQLYAAGYTDENKLLEKLTYKLQYVEQSLCKEFYNRAGLTEGKKTPTHYQCGFAKSNKENCVWDNGMALVSNASGYWMLIGLGIHGPGCAAPARFIDLLPYYPWIESATNLQEIDDDAFYRRSAFNEGFRPKKKPKEDNDEIPVHDLLRSVTEEPNPFDDPLNRVSGKHNFAHYYKFPAWDSGDTFNIERINNSEIELIRIQDGQHGNCSALSNRVIYKDYFKVNMHMNSPLQLNDRGSVTYRLSMYDLYFLNYTCVKIKVVSTVPEAAYLYYSTSLNQFEDLTPENPEEIIRIYPITPSPLFTTTNDRWRPGYHMRPKSVHLPPKRYIIRNLNLFIRIDFAIEGRIEVKVFGPYMGLTTSTTRRTTSERASTSSTLDPYLLDQVESTTVAGTLLRNDPSSQSVEDFESYLRKEESVFDEEAISVGFRFSTSFVYVILAFLLLFV